MRKGTQYNPFVAEKKLFNVYINHDAQYWNNPIP
jgi:hypothetical protein